MPHLLLLLFALLAAPPAPADELRLAVAANFKPALERISRAFEQRSGHRVRLSSGSTGTLFTQIRHGAPYDLFFSADAEAPLALEQSGHAVAGASTCYAVGQLVLVGGSGTLAQLADAALSLAVANPATAPYGRAAQAVLSRPEFAGGAERTLVRGNNAAQAYQLWYAGGTDLALVPASLAPGGTPVPQDWHRPLTQYVAVLSAGAGKPAVDAYLKWVQSDTVAHLLEDAGYRLCP
jgi:molybdate transport system substrate-binding protein